MKLVLIPRKWASMPHHETAAMRPPPPATCGRGRRRRPPRHSPSMPQHKAAAMRNQPPTPKRRGAWGPQRNSHMATSLRARNGSTSPPQFRKPVVLIPGPVNRVMPMGPVGPIGHEGPAAAAGDPWVPESMFATNACLVMLLKRCSGGHLRCFLIFAALRFFFVWVLHNIRQ